MSVKRSKATKVVRNAKKKIPRKMKTRKPAQKKPEKHLVEVPEDPPEEEVVEIEVEPKTRIDLIRSRHSAMKQEIDQIRVALEEEPDD